MSHSSIRTAACLLFALFTLSATGCVARRTVTENGAVTSQKYVVKRPVRDAIKESDN